MQTHVVKAVFRRDVGSSFASPTAYVFITIFVFLCAMAAFWTPRFFDANLANLDALSTWYPWLLLFLVPAVTMGRWAEEKREGTDELLLTLPAGNLELALGKYLASLGIFTAALALAAAGQVGVLVYLGSPDMGLLFSTYLGQWLAGAALIPLGMLASALTANLTVAFILGAVFCAAPVGLGMLGRLMPGTPVERAAELVALPARLEDFARGVATLEGFAYFALLGAIGVWANVFVIAIRRRAGAPGTGATKLLALVRGAALIVAAAAIVSLLSRAAVRADTTAEGLWRLSPETRELVRRVAPERPALITAYVSPDVPASMMQTRETLLGLLRELDSVGGGGGIAVRIVPTEPFTDAAREAEKAYSIRARKMAPGPDDPDQTIADVHLGVAVTCAGEEAVIPFMSRGLSVEYELARAIRSVTAGAQRRVGVLDTAVQMFGEFDFQTYTPRQDWSIIAELRKQYEVVQVAPGEPIDETLDALIAPQPSTLTDEQIMPLLDWIRAGRATLLLEDTLPLFDPGLATAAPRNANQNPFMQQQPPQDEEPKADLSELWSLLGVEVAMGRVAWDGYNPRPQLVELPREFVFVGRGSGAPDSFNDADPVTSGLQEVVVLAGGPLVENAAPTGDATMTPLLRGSPLSGYVAYNEVLQRDIFGSPRFNPNRRFQRTPETPILAARIEGDEAQPLNVVLVGDLDVVSEMFFQMREEGLEGFEFDNVTFVLNAVDALVGDESLVELRKRRPSHRTLARLDELRRAEQAETMEAIEEANSRAAEELTIAQDRMAAKVAEIEQREDLDQTTRAIMIESVRRAEQQRLDVQAAAIEDAKGSRIAEAQAESRRRMDQIEMGIRVAAVALPPIPAFLIGCAVFVRRRALEREGVRPERMRSGGSQR